MNSERVGDSPCWYLVRTNPRQEDRADSNLRARGIETFTPKLRECRFNQYTGVMHPVIKPLFPGYIFARFALNDSFHKVRFTGGVHSLVSFGNSPALVDDEVISIIRSRSRKDGFVKIGEGLEPGDEVVIKEGPLRSFTGIFEREMKGTDRVMVLLKTVSYQAHFEIEMDLVKKVS